MGNKISLGKCVIYCGFSGKRKKTKRKEEEKRREKEELERYEIWLKAEKFKADFPEYCIQAGITPSSIFASAQHLENTLEESRCNKQVHLASTVKVPVPEKQPLKLGTGDVGIISSPDDCCQKSCGKVAKPDNGLRTVVNAKPENKQIVTVSSIYKNNQKRKKNETSKEGKSLSDSVIKKTGCLQNTLVSGNAQDPKSPRIIKLDLTTESKDAEAVSKSTPHRECSKVEDTSSRVTKGSKQSKTESKSGSTTNDSITTNKKIPTVVESLVAKEPSLSTSSSLTQEFNPPLNSTLKPMSSLPDVSTHPKPSSLRQPPSPVPHHNALIRFSSPVPSVSCGPLRSVTFNTTSSFADFQECFRSLSASSSSDTTVSLKKFQLVLSEEDWTQATGKNVRNDSPRAQVKTKSSKNQSKRPRKLSFKWNGQCVYDSGFPSLVVGDRIESASEDEEFCKIRSSNVPTRPVKRHVFGRDILHKHNLISAQELYQDFNKDEVDVYLKERLEQFNHWHFGANVIDNKQHPTNMQGIENTSSSAIVPLGAKPTPQFTCLSAPDNLRNIHDELRELRNESHVLRTGLPRIINSIERRQRVLEARVDVLASRNKFMAFQEADNENLKQKLKALHAEVEQSKYKKTQKRNMASKLQGDVFVEDIEDETRSWSRDSDKEHRQLQPDICELELQQFTTADDHNVMPHPSKQIQRKPQMNNKSNIILTYTDSYSMKSKSKKYNQFQNDEKESDIQAKNFAVDAKKVICIGQIPDVVTSIPAKDTSTEQRDKTTHNLHRMNDVLVGPSNTTLNKTRKSPKLQSSKNKNSKVIENDIFGKTSLEQNITFSDRDCDNCISDVCNVTEHPNKEDIELSPEPQFKDILENKTIPKKKDLEKENTLIIQNLAHDPKSDKSNSKSKILSAENKKQSTDNRASGNLNAALLTSAQFPTTLLGAIDQQTTCGTKRQDSNERIEQNSKDVTTESCHMESATDIKKKKSVDEKYRVQKPINHDLDSSMLLSTNQNANSAMMKTMNSSSDVRNSTKQIPTDVLLANSSYSGEIVPLDIEVVDPSEVVKNKQNMSLKESTPYSSRNGNDIQVEHQQLSESTKVWSSSKQVVPGKAMNMKNINTGKDIKAGIKSEIMSDQVVSKLHKDFRSPKAMHSNQLVSNNKEDIKFLDSDLDDKTKTKSEIVLSDYEHLDHKPIVREIIHNNDWKSAQSNFDNCGVELKSQDVEIAEQDLGAFRNKTEMQPRVSTQKETMQNVLEHGGKYKRNLKPKFELGRNKVGFEKNKLVFRNDTRKMKQPQDSYSSGSTSHDQEGLITERIITTDVVIASDLHKDVKEILSDDLKQNVKSRKAGELSCKVYNEVIKDNDKDNIKMFKETVLDERNKTCPNQIERDKEYYEIGNLDKIIEEMLDGGFRNVENRGSYPIVEKYMQNTMNSKEKTGEKDVLSACLFDESSEDGASTQIAQHETGWESVFKLESTLQPTLREKSNVEQDEGVSFQDENINVVANLSNITKDGKSKDDLEENQTDSVKHVNQKSRGKELCNSKHGIFGMQNQQNKEPLCGLQCQGPKDLLDKEDFTQHKNESMPPKTESPHSCTTLQSSSPPSIAKSNPRESTSQDDTTMASLKRRTSDRKSPNLFIPDVDTTKSECLSSPEPSLQEGVISGKTDFEKTIERYILPGTNNSYFSNGRENKPLPNSSFFERKSPFHENLKISTSTSERNVFPEDKSGYISEADFDTSFSDNLSYVEEDLMAIKRATVKEIDGIENEKHMKNTGVCDDAIFKEKVSRNETPFEPETKAKLYLPPNVSSKEMSLKYAKVERSGKHEVLVNPVKSDSEDSLDLEKISQHPEHLETNPGEDSNIITDANKYMSNPQSKLQGTEMQEIPSRQENFQGVIFRNLDVVPIAPSKETSFAQNLCDIRNSGQTSNQKMLRGTLESDHEGRDKFSNNVREVTLGLIEVTSECDKINTGENDAFPSYNHVTTSESRASPNHKEVKTAYKDDMLREQKTTADDFSKNSVCLLAKKNDNKGIQNSSFKGDVDLRQKILSSESIDVLSTEFEIDRETEGKITKTNGNTFQCQQLSSSDNLIRLHANMDEEEIDRHSLDESNGAEVNNVLPKDVALKDYFAPQSKDFFSGKGDYPNKNKKIGRKTFKRNATQNKEKNVEDSSNSSTQEGTIYGKRRGEVNFQKNIKRSVLAGSNSSYSRHDYSPLPNHSSQRNVFSYEDKSGYVAEVEFDTSDTSDNSNNLSYVKHDLMEIANAKTEDIERTENKYCMKNTDSLDYTMFSGDVSSDVSARPDRETESCPTPGVSNKISSLEFVHHDKHFHDSSNDIRGKVGAQLIQSNNAEYLDSLGKYKSQSLHDVRKRSKQKAQIPTGTNPADEFNITIDGAKETSRVQSLATGISTSQETLEETGSQQRCFKKDIFDAATTTIHNDKDMEQSFDQLLNSKQSSYQKMLCDTTESDCEEFHNKITPSYNILSDNNEDATPGTNELASRFGEITKGYNEVQRNYCNVIPGDDPKFIQAKSESHASLSHNEITSSLEEVAPQHNKMTADDPVKGSARCSRKENDDISAHENASHEEMHGEILFSKTVEKDILLQTNSSGNGKKTLPSQQNIKKISGTSERNVSPEKRSGSIGEADFDTSFSENLSYVEEDLMEVKRARTDELEGMERKQCVRNARALDLTMVNEYGLSDEKQFKHAVDTNQSQSLANVQSTLQETEMPMIRSEQKSFNEIILGNADVVSITSSTEKVKTSEVKDIMFAHEKNLEQNLDDIGSFNKSINLKTCSDPMMVSGTSEPDCNKSFLSRSKVTPSHNMLPNSYKDVRPSTNKPKSESKSVKPRYNSIPTSNDDVIPSINEVTTSYKMLVPNKDEFTVGNCLKDSSSQLTHVKEKDDVSVMENDSDAKINIGGPQDISMEYDRENYSSEEEDIISVKYKLRQHVTKGKIAGSEVNNFRCQNVSSNDDLKLQLHSNKEQGFNDQVMIKSSTSENEIKNTTRQNITPESYPVIEKKSLFKRNISNYDHEMKNNGRQMIALRDDFVLNSDKSVSTSKSTRSNKTTEISEQVFIESSISEDEIKKAERRQIALEDDFQLPSENSIRERRYCHPNGENENTTLKDELPNPNLNNLGRKENYLKQENMFSRQTFNDVNYYGDNDDAPNPIILKESRFKYDTNNPSASKDGCGFDIQKEERKIEHVDEYMIDDPDYRLNTLSDISSISDDMSVGVKISNMYHKNVIEQETNHHHGKSENKLLATNQRGDPNNLNNTEDRNEEGETPKTQEGKITLALSTLLAEMGLIKNSNGSEKTFTPSPPPKPASPDPNSHAMSQLRNIMRGIKPSNAARQVATQKILQTEIERQQKEQDEKLYESKERGTRCLEKFRDDVFLKPKSVSPRKQVSYAGFGAALHTLPNDPRLQSRSLSGLGYGSHIEGREQNDPATVRESKHNPVQYLNKSSPSNVQHIQPAYEPCMQPSDDEDSYLNEIFLQQDSRVDIGLERSQTFCEGNQNDTQQKSSTSFNYGSKTQPSPQNEPTYRTPDCRRPAALVPLNVGKSAPNLASKVASFQAAFGFGASDPWKPKPLPDIEQEGLTPRRSDSLLKQKPMPIPRLDTSMKTPVLPDIGTTRPLQRRPLPGITPDIALYN